MYLAAKAVLKSNLLTEWKGRTGRFVRTFGMNSKRNKNEWRATWDSIKKNIHTAIDYPGIEYEACVDAKCDLDHVEAETFKENVEKQKPFSRTNIIDFVLDEKEESVDLIHEVLDDEFWKRLNNEELFVSPLIWPVNNGVTVLGKGRIGLPIIDTTDWKFVHDAFLTKDPAYGTDTATVKTMCEGKNCDVKLLSAQTLPITTLIEKKEYLPGKEIPLCGNCKFFVEDGLCSLVKGEIKAEDVCNLHIFGKTQPKGTKVSPDFEKERVNYRHPESKSLEAETTIANQENISHLQEIPLLYKHKGQLILLSASSCVQEIIRKKKEDGIEIDDQALAIAYSECGESKKAKSSFKTCTCIAKQNKMDQAELEKENTDLKSKLKAMEDREEIEKSRESHKGRYAKLFANVDEDEREKMISKMKGMTDDHDKDELKAMEEVHEEMKSKKAMEHDPEKEDMKARLEAMEDEKKEEKMKAMVTLQAKYGLTAKEQNEYYAGLKGKSYKEVMSKFEDVEPIIKSMKATTIPNKENNFKWNGGDINSLKGKTFEEISEASQ